MATVLIGGGTGLIGMRLSVLLKEKGYTVLHLSRTQNLEAEFPAYQWNLHQQTIEEEAIRKAAYIINLAGAGIADKPWTSARKKVIIESRTLSNQLLRKAVEEHKVTPKAYIAGAAIGIYGDRGDELLTENSQPGKEGFLAESCKQWESAINEWQITGIRTVAIRTGVVLANEGGALPKMTMSLPMGVAPYFGNGQAWYSWIHIDDIANMFLFALEQASLEGYYNGVAPLPVRNKELVQAIVKAKNAKALVMPTPSFALRLAMGEMADAILSSSKVSAEKIEAAGFTFNFPDVDSALKDLLKS